MADDLNTGADPERTGISAAAAIMEFNNNAIAFKNTTNVLAELLVDLPDKITASISKFLVPQSNVSELRHATATATTTTAAAMATASG